MLFQDETKQPAKMCTALLITILLHNAFLELWTWRGGGYFFSHRYLLICRSPCCRQYSSNFGNICLLLPTLCGWKRMLLFCFCWPVYFVNMNKVLLLLFWLLSTNLMLGMKAFIILLHYLVSYKGMLPLGSEWFQWVTF